MTRAREYEAVWHCSKCHATDVVKNGPMLLDEAYVCARCRPPASVRFTVIGQPVPKGRPRFFKGVAVTPQRTRDYERHVRNVAALYCAHWDRTGAYRVTLEFIGPRLIGDLDNYAKAVLDGMNGYAFEDDRQVTELRGFKHSLATEQPRVEVLVERIGDKPMRRKRKAVG